AGEWGRGRMLRREGGDAAQVVAVLVGHDDAGEIRGVEADPPDALGGLADAEAAVHHPARAVALDDEGIAPAAATETREPQRRPSTSAGRRGARGFAWPSSCFPARLPCSAR